MKYKFNIEYDKVILNDYMVISDKSFTIVYLLKDLEQHILNYLIQFDSEKVNNILQDEFKNEYIESDYRDFIQELVKLQIIITDEPSKD